MAVIDAIVRFPTDPDSDEILDRFVPPRKMYRREIPGIHRYVMTFR
jgi:hypothetical protein